MRRNIYELQQSVKAEKKKNAKLDVQLLSVLQRNSKLEKCIKFMHNLDIEDVLV